MRATNATGTGPVSAASTAVAPQAVTLSAGTATAAGMTLTIGNYSLAWYYKYTTPDGGDCSAAAVPAGTPTKTLTTLTSNTAYTFKAYSDSGCSDELAAAASYATLPPKPTTPTVAAGVGSGKLTLSSLATSGGDVNLIKWEYTTDNGTNWTDISSTSTTLSYTVTGFQNNTAYTFKVRASNASGASEASDASQAVAPVDETLTVDTITTIGATLTIGNWSAKWYYKHTSPSNGSCSTPAVPAGTSTKAVTGLTPNTSYTFKAYSDSGCSTSTVLATASAFPTKPPKPDTPMVTAGMGSGKLKLASSVTGTASLTKWQYTKDNGTSWTDISSTSTTLSHIVPGLTNGTAYTFKVRAWNASGKDMDSEASDAVTPVPTTTPTASRTRYDPPTFGNQRIPDQPALQNTPIVALTLPAATGGNPPLRYKLEPDLPAGLTFDPVTRVLAGTPTKPQKATPLTYTVMDSTGQQAGLTFTLTVEADLQPTFGDQTIANQAYMQDQAIEALTLPKATSGNPPLRYKLEPDLPAGLTFDPVTRTLAGTPTKPQKATRYTYTVTDKDRDAVLLPFVITVRLAADRAILEDGLAAQGRALLSSATGVIGARFRTPGASSVAGVGECPGETGPGPVEGEEAGGAGADPDCTTGLLNTVAQAVLAMSGGGAAGEDRLDLADEDDSRPGGPRMVNGGSQPAWDWESLVWGRSFALPLKTPGAPGSAWTLWGAGDVQGFQGTPRQGQYDGQVRSLYLGVDTRWQEQWLAGAALAQSWGTLDYGAGGVAGQLETTLTSVYPYVRGTLGAGLEVWAIGGYGRGEAENTRPGAVETSDLSMAMGATGARQPMTEFGGVQVAVVGGAGYLSLATDAGDSLVPDLDVAVNRARLAVEATWTAGGLAPYVQVGGRYDGGAGQTGAGLETVAGVRYTSERLEFEARGRWLATHAADGYTEYGGLARLAVKPQADGTGFRMTVAPRWGAAEGAGVLGGGAALLDGGALPGLGVSGIQAATNQVLAVESELGYGVAVFDGQGVLTPYGGFALTGAETRQYRLGARLGMAQWLTLSLEGTRREATGPQPADQGVQLQLQGRF